MGVLGRKGVGIGRREGKKNHAKRGVVKRANVWREKSNGFLINRATARGYVWSSELTQGVDSYTR